MTTDTGWLRENAWSQPGMVLTGTNAADANTSTATIGKNAACAVSAFGASSPSSADIHDSAYENRSTSASPARSPSRVVW